MRILVDANLLVRLAMPAEPQYQQAFQALVNLWRLGHEPVVVPQVLYEYWVVATRPKAQNGLALSPSAMDSELDSILQVHRLLRDRPSTFYIWRSLVSKYQVIGKKAHDVRLVAAMLRHGVTHLLTFNDQDFVRFTEVTVMSPGSTASLPPAMP